MKLPLTESEKGLANQIQSEIEEMSGEYNRTIEELDQSTDPKEQNDLLRRAAGISRQIARRSKVREDVFNAAIDRLSSKY